MPNTLPQMIATIIANPASSISLADLTGRLPRPFSVSELGAGEAWDVSGDDLSDVPDLLSGLSVDVVIQPSANRRKRLLLADMDSTIIQQECLDELAAAAGSGPAVAAVTARAMAGEIEFEPALRERVATLAGKPVSLIDSVLRDIITLTPGAETLVATMRANGGYCALVSGGFTQFTGAIASRLGFDEHRANTFETLGQTFTGSVVPPILGREAKVEALRDICRNRGLDAADVLAVGDGANDLGMLSVAGTGVALHAKPVVAQTAPHRIDHGDLTALLYIQGYRRSEFV